MVGRRLILGALLVALVALPGTAKAQEPLVVAGTHTIQGGEHTFQDRITVLPGSTLIIRDAKIYLDQVMGSCPIGGNLVQFCYPHLFVMPGATLVVERSTFDTRRPVDRTKTTEGYMVYTYGGTLVLKDSTFLRMNRIGGEGPGPMPSTITNSTFALGIQPLTFTRGALAHIEGNTVRDSRLGIDLRDANFVVRNNLIHDIAGYAIDLQGTSVGDKALPTRALVEGNTVRRALAAFYSLNGYSSTVRDNVFADSRHGAVLGVNTGSRMVHSEQIVFENNRLEGNDTSLYAYASGTSDLETVYNIIVPVRNSVIVDSKCLAARVNARDNPYVIVTLDARSNWWGSADGPSVSDPDCDAIEGNVLVEPWLTEAPF